MFAYVSDIDRQAIIDQPARDAAEAARRGMTILRVPILSLQYGDLINGLLPVRAVAPSMAPCSVITFLGKGTKPLRTSQQTFTVWRSL